MAITLDPTNRLWVYIEWNDTPDGHHISPSCCHPDMAQARIDYVLREHGGKVRRIIYQKEMWADQGGMVCTDDPQFSVDVGEGRSFGTWMWQIRSVLRQLSDATRFQIIDGTSYYRFSRFPGVINFLREDERLTVVNALKAERARQPNDAEAVHKLQMGAALRSANEAMARAARGESEPVH